MENLMQAHRVAEHMAPGSTRTPQRISPSLSAALSLAFVLVLAACGGSADVESTTAAASDEAIPAGPSVEDIAAENAASLTIADDPLDTEILAVDDGSVASVRAAVTGDRPVLLWFWAPH